MENARGFIGVLAMWFFGACVLIGWILMVGLPLLSGSKPIAHLGLLTFWTLLSLVVWRLAGGKGWGLRDDEGPKSREERSVITDAAVATDTLPADWSRALSNLGWTPERVRRLADGPFSRASSVLPKRFRVYRALTLTPLSKVKLVIVGKDPYFRRGQADGLAFSVTPSADIPHSLSRIFSNLESDSSLSFTRPRSGELTAWARQGVLLLNTALTVEEGSPGSHHDHWADFTRDVLRVASAERRPLVFLLWGDDANALGDSIALDEARHRVIRSTHPRQESESRYPRFADTRPFSEANTFLEGSGQAPINWNL